MVASYYYHYDAMGSTERLTDSSQSTVDTYTYPAFGARIGGGKGEITNWYGWLGRIGYHSDAFTSQLQVWARRYDCGIGRWISQDPIGFGAGDANLYRYVRNNPVNAVDPSGFIVIVPPFERQVCCTYNNGSTIWSQTEWCFKGNSASACCGSTASGVFWSWHVVSSSDGSCSPPPPPRDFCNQDWAKLDWTDCVACCVKNSGVNAYAGAGTATSGVLGWRVPKPHPQPGQYPDQSWLYGPRRCLPKCARPTLNTVRTVGRWAGRVFIVTGVAEFGLECACGAYCSAQ